MRTKTGVIGILLLAGALLAGRTAAVVYTFGDATLSAKKIEVQLKDREAVATGAPILKMRDWRVGAQTIRLAFDDQRLPTSADFAGGVSFDGKLRTTPQQSNRPAADTLKAKSVDAQWTRDPRWTGAARDDKGILTLSGGARVEAGSGERTGVLTAGKIVTRLNAGALVGSGRATVTTADARLEGDVIDLIWEIATSAIASAQAEGNVIFLYTARDTAGNATDTYSGACASASWGRDPGWKGTPLQDQGIAVLRGKVRAESTSGDGKEKTTIACESLTIMLNERRYIAEGGPEGQVDLESGKEATRDGS